MNTALVVTGTDTDVGKTVFAAALTAALGGAYWKPIQAGLDGETDSDVVRRLGELPQGRVLPEVYRLKTPSSPHFAAERDGIAIDPERLGVPKSALPLVIEAAGGLAVPLTRTLLQIDLIARWRIPAILVAATRLGTINHSLLSIEALRRRGIPILGIAFVGNESADSQRTICEMGGVKSLGRLPHLETLSPKSLQAAFAANLDVTDVLGPGSRGP